MKITTLIFDFDGTLFDTSKDIAEAMNKTLTYFNKKPLDDKVIWSYTGDGFRKTIERLFPNEDKELIRKAEEVAYKFYVEISSTYATPIDNVIEFLLRNKQRKVILSNKPYEPLVKILDKFNIRNLFEKIYGFESLPVVKPNPETINIISEDLNVPKEEMAIIGDAEQDVLTAINANIKCFIIPSKSIETKHHFIIFKDYDELEEILKNYKIY